MASEKNLTAVLLDAAKNIIGFGREARRRFHEMDPEEQRTVLYLEQFKMIMAPFRRGGRPLHSRAVHAQGADVAIPLVEATAKVLEAVAVEAKDRIASLGVRADCVQWVITVPAIWDDEAKHFMRAAAVMAGIVAAPGSAQLTLCLEPEGAVIASIADMPAASRRRLVPGCGVMILDCGGGTVDVTVSQIVADEPISLREVLPSSGDAWGGTLVDAEARKFFNALLCPPGSVFAAEPADASSLAAMLDSWEAAKTQWDPDDLLGRTVKVGGLAAVCEAVGGASAMADRVASYNKARGLIGTDEVVYKPRAFSLWLPVTLVKTFFDPCVDRICSHMLHLFRDVEELDCSIDFVFLVGGFAESVYLQVR
jgi:hypothetical protein